MTISQILLEGNINSYTDLVPHMERVIQDMDELDDVIFARCQKSNPYSEQASKLQSLGNSLNSCSIIFSYIETYEKSEKTNFDFLKIRHSVKKLVKILLDIERILNIKNDDMPTSIYA